MLAGSKVKSVELWEPTFRREKHFVQEARDTFLEAGVEPRTVHANFGNQFDISSPDESTRASALSAVEAALELAVNIGAGIIVVHPSAEPIDKDERLIRLKQAQKSIEAIARRVSEAGCSFALELLPRTCLGSTTSELLRLLENVEQEAAGVCLDTNHLMNGFRSLPEVVRTLGPRLVTLHCSDYDGVDEKHWPPLRGVIDWSAFLSALHEVGYSGPLHYEADLEGNSPAEKLAFLEDNFAKLTMLQSRAA
jgi:sugar phosphate isomerase/epimerase